MSAYDRSSFLASGPAKNTKGYPKGKKEGLPEATMTIRHLARGLRILYEDSSILVVDKPAGLLSIGTESEKEHTAYWILSTYLKKRGEKRNVAVVHRLDRETSGVLLFAKSAVTKKILMEHWDELVICRQYVAVVEGLVRGEEGTIDLHLQENQRGHMVVDPRGQRAVTRWKVLQRGPSRTLLSLELETGRKNQIRVHLAAIGHPVVGDTKYGYSLRKQPHGHHGGAQQTVRRDRKTRKTGQPHIPSKQRLLLHAELLAFYHPITGSLMEFFVPPPIEFQRLLYIL
ncbi:MAG: RluA family pseudouridine synthase [Treponemataceae bacterium]|nr:RluA family pseudouridine synthase [Treponemataceae bacterium]